MKPLDNDRDKNFYWPGKQGVISTLTMSVEKTKNYEKVFANYEVKSKGVTFKNPPHVHIDDNMHTKDKPAEFPLTLNKQIDDVNRKSKISRIKEKKKYSLVHIHNS